MSNEALMLEILKDLQQRLTNIENDTQFLKMTMGTVKEELSHIYLRMSSTEDRLLKIEKRLNLN